MIRDDKITIMYHGKPQAALFVTMAPSRLDKFKDRFTCSVWHPPGKFDDDAWDRVYFFLRDEGTLWVPGWGAEQSAELRAAWTMAAL